MRTYIAFSLELMCLSMLSSIPPGLPIFYSLFELFN